MCHNDFDISRPNRNAKEEKDKIVIYASTILSFITGIVILIGIFITRDSHEVPIGILIPAGIGVAGSISYMLGMGLNEIFELKLAIVFYTISILLLIILA